ncbi:MAG: hypothetical protein B7Z55_16495, partial [Planctomycetales bacterium 12-60-4]
MALAFLPRQFRTWLTAVVLTSACGLCAQSSDAATPKGLGDPGQLQKLRVEPNLEGKGISLRGRDSRQQLFVTGEYSSGQLRDHTRTVQYSSEPADFIAVDGSGYLTPLKDAQGIVRVTASGNLTAELAV